jgi:hypothetical protein
MRARRARPSRGTRASRARTGKPDRRSRRYARGSSKQPPLPWARVGELNSGRRGRAQASSNPVAASARGGARPNRRYRGHAPASSNPGAAGGHGRVRTWPPPPQARAGEGHGCRFQFLTIPALPRAGELNPGRCCRRRARETLAAMPRARKNRAQSTERRAEKTEEETGEEAGASGHFYLPGPHVGGNGMARRANKFRGITYRCE